MLIYEKNYFIFSSFFLALAVFVVSYSIIFTKTRYDLIFKTLLQIKDVSTIKKIASVIDLSIPEETSDNQNGLLSTGNNLLGLNKKKSRNNFIYYEGLYVGKNQKQINQNGLQGHLNIIKFSDNAGNINWFVGGGRINNIDLFVEYFDPAKNPDIVEFDNNISQKLIINNVYQLEIPTSDFFQVNKIIGGNKVYPYWLYYKLMTNPVENPEIRAKRAQNYLFQYYLLESNKISNLTINNFNTLNTIIPIVGITAK